MRETIIQITYGIYNEIDSIKSDMNKDEQNEKGNESYVDQVTTSTREVIRYI